ncbi:magnesium transporter [Saccharomonospora sp. CUA-673]|uniref:magnesium transporter n=1 Tax=Saccharomonospora sp. CUA-673 TaxID=1904969 RepID=UPI000969272B|nr:magnesium transporter [Saccharomonospora sp. CUA-673]OLT41216.1 magnesium transporter [Saccharomonospora sp. CUA-673]
MNAALKNLIDTEATTDLRDLLADTPTVTIAEELAHLDPTERAVAFRLLNKDEAVEVFDALDPEHQATLLDGLREDRVRELVEAMAADDRARLFDEMPAKVAARLQQGLSREQRQATATLLGYPAGSAGRIMLPVTTTLDAHLSREEALARLSGRSDRGGELAVLPVTDGTRRLIGTVTLTDLATAPAGARVDELLARDLYQVSAHDDRETAARLVQEADLLALPVVDGEHRLLGVITVDDAMEVLEAEVTEDAYRTGGAEPINVPYLSATVFHLARTRAVWLLVLILAAVMTVNVLEYFETTLESMVTLALFIPLLIDTGGNAGSQAATAVIRALAVGEVRVRDLPRILWREARVGLALGLLLAGVGFPIAAFFYGFEFGAIIAVTLLAICLWASSVGGVLPLVAHKLRIDPAVFSAPVVTTLVDASGLILYFLVAGAVLGL